MRRVVALAHLALKWPRGGIVAALRGALLSPPAATSAQGAARAQPVGTALVSLVTVPCPDGYWLSHWDFGIASRGAVGLEVAPGNETPALVGAGRAADVVVNVLLPLAAACAARGGETALAEAARSAYRSHPALAENWITRLVRERSALTTPLGARAQQGLLHVYQQTCHALRCADCALAPAAAGGS